jgi:phytoene dehydrogenase-like protein
MPAEFDFVVIGSGMAGLTAGALLAKAGHSVCLLEAHEYPGGCAHSFPMGRYTFCAAVHYIFFCGEGEPVYNLLKKLGLHERIRFARLDPEGYDHFRCPSAGLSFRIPNGLEKWAERLADRFPRQRPAIVEFFAVVRQLAWELRQLPWQMTARDLLRGWWRLPAVRRYRRWTLERLLEKLRLSAEVRAILATQFGDLGLPPADMSLAAYAALVWCYGQGAYHPIGHFKELIDGLADSIRTSPNSAIEYQTEVTQMRVDGRRLAEVRTADGRTFTGRTFIVNFDPRACVEMLGRERFPRWFLKQTSYDYSISSYTIYLGLRDLDLREHGFGSFNVWHYPNLDINGTYRRQTVDGDLSDPCLFLSTPTLHEGCRNDEACPPGEQILEIVTVCDYERFRSLKNQDHSAYHRRKKEITDRILEIVERHYVPGLREHIAIKVSGSPTTNERYLWAPQGNIYGSAMTPANVDFGRLKFRTPLENLYFTGASAEFPSIGATVVGGSRLYTHLTGDPVNPGRDLYGLW